MKFFNLISFIISVDKIMWFPLFFIFTLRFHWQNQFQSQKKEKKNFNVIGKFFFFTNFWGSHLSGCYSQIGFIDFCWCSCVSFTRQQKIDVILLYKFILYCSFVFFFCWKQCSRQLCFWLLLLANVVSFLIFNLYFILYTYFLYFFYHLTGVILYKMITFFCFVVK